MSDSSNSFQICFEERFHLCWMLLELSRQQQHWIDTDNYDRLMCVLGQKQSMLEQLNRSGSNSSQLLEDWKRERDSLSTSVRGSCDELLEKTEACLRELQQIEDQCAQQLELKVGHTRKELESLSHGKGIHQAYRASTPSRTSRLLDIGQ